jgi:hypothetical protein
MCRLRQAKPQQVRSVHSLPRSHEGPPDCAGEKGRVTYFSQKELTLRIYAHVIPQSQRDSMQAVSGQLLRTGQSLRKFAVK